MKKKIIIGISGICLLFFGTVYAGVTTNYSTTVGKFNGSGYTNYQTKSVAGQKADIWSTSVGGNYVVDVRTQSSGSNGTWSRSLNDNQYRQLTNGHNRGTNVRLQFSNNLCTPVDVQVTGSWNAR